MKEKIRFGVICVLLCLSLSACGKKADTEEVINVTTEKEEKNMKVSYTGYTTEEISVRSGASETYGIIGKIQQGLEVQVTGDPGNGWLQIAYGDAKAYCLAESVSKENQNGTMDEGSEPLISVSATDASYIGYATIALNVRTGPSKDYQSIGALAYGQAVQVTGECENGWFRVEFNGQEAYCSGNYISKSVPAAEETEEYVIPQNN